METERAKQAAWAMDLRVRHRLLASGALDPKLVERFLAELPDLEGYAEPLPFEQPALTRGGHGEGGSGHTP